MPWRARSSRPAVSESMCPASSWSRMLIAPGWSSMPSSRASATAAATALLEVFAVVATPTFYLVGSALASHGAMAVRSRLGGGADGQSRSSQREGALGLNAQNPSSPRPRMAPGFTSAGSCLWHSQVSPGLADVATPLGATCDVQPVRPNSSRGEIGDMGSRHRVSPITRCSSYALSAVVTEVWLPGPREPTQA